MLRWRLLLGTLIVAGLLGLCWLDQVAERDAARPGIWLLPLAALLTLTATAELLQMARAAGMQPLPWIVYLGNLCLVAGQGLLMLGHQATPSPLGREWPAIVLAVSLVLLLAAEMWRYHEPGGILASLGASVFALLYVGLLLSFAVRLRMDWGIAAVASWIIPVKMGDIGAYSVGRWIGRHKMAPVLSPGKTLEGALGALAFACLGSWATFFWLVPLLGGSPGKSGSWDWLLLGLLLGALGMLGDLAESLLKRDAGCKDSSQWLPGFGGVLDLLDSLLLTAPVVWLWWAVAGGLALR
ncbi:MAG: phosphatidate cytidylyltransferase [Thermoguttaceae bacterium]|jgi:phosphatidate cytidylyltransferase